MNGINPLYIPRNDQVEKMLVAAIQQNDFAPFHELLRVLNNPFTEQPGMEQYAARPTQTDTPYKTFCGT